MIDIEAIVERLVETEALAPSAEDVTHALVGRYGATRTLSAKSGTAAWLLPDGRFTGNVGYHADSIIKVFEDDLEIPHSPDVDIFEMMYSVGNVRTIVFGDANFHIKSSVTNKQVDSILRALSSGRFDSVIYEIEGENGYSYDQMWSTEDFDKFLIDLRKAGFCEGY